MTKLTATRVRSLLDYDLATGAFVWRARPARCIQIGVPAGRTDRNGYSRITIGRVGYLAHRLAWLIGHGEWPAGQIDHIDGNRSNNAITNLRVASRSQNRANSKMASHNKAGLKGVCLVRGRWIASIKHQDRSKHLGCFDTREAAHAAYVAAATQLHGEFARAA